MTDRTPFLLAILSGQEGAREMYADWLLERGEDDEAALWWHTPWPRTEAFCSLSLAAAVKPNRYVRLVGQRDLADHTIGQRQRLVDEIKGFGVDAEVEEVPDSFSWPSVLHVVRVGEDLWHVELRPIATANERSVNAAAL